jgi:hypothetical protein
MHSTCYILLVSEVGLVYNVLFENVGYVTCNSSRNGEKLNRLHECGEKLSQ